MSVETSVSLISIGMAGGIINPVSEVRNADSLFQCLVPKAKSWDLNAIPLLLISEEDPKGALRSFLRPSTDDLRPSRAEEASSPPSYQYVNDPRWTLGNSFEYHFHWGRWTNQGLRSQFPGNHGIQGSGFWRDRLSALTSRATTHYPISFRPNFCPTMSASPE